MNKSNGSTMSDDQSVKINPDGGTLELRPKGPVDAKAENAAAIALTVTCACANGHEWGEVVGRRRLSTCPHGRGADGRAAQVNLVCPVCGAGYAVVGDATKTTCPRCGTAMVCLRCLAQTGEEHPHQVHCPVCGETNISVLRAPPVTFRGDVHKEIR